MYVDDTFVVQQLEHKENFFKHISSIDQSVKLTVENTLLDASMSFLDTFLTTEPCP